MTDVQKWECKIVCLQQPQEDPIKLNPNKVKAPENSLIRISSKGDASKCVYAKVTAFDRELRNHGLSIEFDLSKVFDFQSNEEVVVEVVDKAQCTIHMVEVLCADQYVSRGDMWRFKESLKDSCTYKKKHMDFSGITVQVNALYDSNGKMSSGYISEDTRMTYRSLSSYTQLFIQIGKEMWANDYEGMENWENFEKVVYQFVKTLFEKWESKKANHDLQIIFFARILFDGEYPENKADMIQHDGDGNPYLDIYDVICDGGNITDVKPIMRLMKRRFTKLGLIIADLKQTYKVEVSASSKGNFLECINLALDQYNNHFQDRVHYRCGQQIVVVTAGSGLFYVDRELAAFTKHRVLDLGVGADVVCLGKKPLHATPLFVFQPQVTLNKKSEERIFDKYQVPHWMNVHFYASLEQTGKFVPITMGIKENDDMVAGTIVPFKGPAPSFHDYADLTHCTDKDLNQLCEEYDTKLMMCPVVHAYSNYEIHPEDCPNSFSSDTEINSSSVGTVTMDRRKTASYNAHVETNPFNPSRLPRPITNSRRRWAHVFPCSSDLSEQKPKLYGLSRSLVIEQDPEAEYMDWQSLIAPACFPTSTDYYPDTSYIDKNSKEHGYVLTTENKQQFIPELIIQRLSRGFQLVPWKKNHAKTLTFSLGHTYHDIQLQDNYTNSGTIKIKMSKPTKKAQYPASKRVYKYCLIPYLGTLENIDTSLINCQSERKTREHVVDGKWNAFDLYIQELVDNDIGDEERPKNGLEPWRSRYAILPRPDLYFPNHDVGTLKTSSSNEGKWGSSVVVNRFYNILFAMNNIKHQDNIIKHQDSDPSDFKRHSLSVGAGYSGHSAPNSPSYNSFDSDLLRPRTNTLVDSKNLAFSFSQSGGSGSEEDNSKSDDKDSSKGSSYFKIFQKGKTSDNLDVPDLKTFREKIIAPTSGMKFISKLPKSSLPGHMNQPILPPNTFLASALVDWVLRTESAEVRYKAVEFCQELLRLKYIEVTNDEYKDSPYFVDGFYFYHLRPEKAPKDRITPKIIFEVSTPEAPNKIELFDPIRSDNVYIQSSLRSADRKEFFSVDYDSCYDPQHSFGLLVQWDRATAQLIEVGYLSKWRAKAEKAGFQLVQVPLNPFHSAEIAPNVRQAVPPFRAPIDISVPLVDAYAMDTMEDMLFQFGFLHDYPAGEFSKEQLESKSAEIETRINDYVHLSGIALVRVVHVKEKNTAVLKWVSNPFLGSKKWHPKIFLPNNKKEEKFYQMSFEELLTRFREHVSNYFTPRVQDTEV